MSVTRRPNPQVDITERRYDTRLVTVKIGTADHLYIYGNLCELPGRLAKLDADVAAEVLRQVRWILNWRG